MVSIPGMDTATELPSRSELFRLVPFVGGVRGTVVWHLAVGTKLKHQFMTYVDMDVALDFSPTVQGRGHRGMKTYEYRDSSN